jgi:hypothetical protein
MTERVGFEPLDTLSLTRGFREGYSRWRNAVDKRVSSFGSRASGFALREQLSETCGLCKEIFQKGALRLCILTVVTMLPGVLVALGCAC